MIPVEAVLEGVVLAEQVDLGAFERLLADQPIDLGVVADEALAVVGPDDVPQLPYAETPWLSDLSSEESTMAMEVARRHLLANSAGVAPAVGPPPQLQVLTALRSSATAIVVIDGVVDRLVLWRSSVGPVLHQNTTLTPASPLRGMHRFVAASRHDSRSRLLAAPDDVSPAAFIRRAMAWEPTDPTDPIDWLLDG